MMRDHVGISYFQWLHCERMQVSLEEARKKFPELIALVEGGESITITRDKIPVAKLLSAGTTLEDYLASGWKSAWMRPGRNYRS